MGSGADAGIGVARWPGILAVLFLGAGVVGCATGAGGGGGGGGSGAPGTVSVITGAGETWELRRDPEVRANPRVEASPAAAWQALPHVYLELEMVPDLQEPAARTLGVSEHRFTRRVFGRPPSDFFDCGLDAGLNLPLADRSPIDARVVTQVLGSGATAEIQTRITASARRSGGNAGTATCQSTGLLETLIGAMVRERVEGPGASGS
jgi:hypothetical protein